MWLRGVFRLWSNFTPTHAEQPANGDFTWPLGRNRRLRQATIAGRMVSGEGRIAPAWLGGGAFNVLLFHQFFKRVPRELAEAAIDGATTWRTFISVMLPAARPVVITAAILSFVFHWKDFFRPLIYLTDFRTFPISLGLRMYQTATGSWINLLMAASLMSLVPLAAVFLLCQRYLMRGLEVSHRREPR